MQPLHTWDYNDKTATFMTAMGHCLVIVWQNTPDCWHGRIESGRRQLVRSDCASLVDLETWVDMVTTMLNATDRRQRER